MSYTIVRTDGSVLTEIPDGVVNTTSTPLSLPGRNYSSYGVVMDTNFVRQLENFADSTVPDNPIRGQLYYNTSTENLYICPTDGETNLNNWIRLLSSEDGNLSFDNLTLSGNLYANNAFLDNELNANHVIANYLTINVSANIADATLTGNSNVSNLKTANITTGSQSTSGQLTGSWNLTGNLSIPGGNLSAANVRTDNYCYANGDPIVFLEAAGVTNEVQYNINGSLDSSSAFTFDPTSSKLTVSGDLEAINATMTGIISGDGSGITNLSGSSLTGTIDSLVQSNITQLGTLSTLTVTGSINTSNVVASDSIIAAKLTGSLTTAAQPNITSVGTLSALSVTGNATAGNVYANSGTVRGSLLSGTLTTAAQPNITSVGTLSSLTVSGNINSGNISASSGVFTNINGTLKTAAQPNITSVGTLTSLSVIGAISGLTISGDHTGNGAGLSSITGANVTGTVANATNAVNATSAITAGTVTTAAQPNITSVGTLTALNVSGNIGAVNINASNISGNHIGDGSKLTSLPGANVNGKVANATYSDNSNYSGTAGTVINPTQANITSLGTLNSLAVSGDIIAGGMTVNGNTNFSLGTQQVRDVIDQVSINATAISGTVNVDLLGPSTVYYTSNSAGNWTFNFRGSSTITTNSYLPVGRSVTTTILVKQGTVPYYPTAFNIDGSSVTPKWLGGTPPTSGNANSINSYEFTIVKTGSTPSYAVFASAKMYSETPPLPTSADRTCIAVIDECSVAASMISSNWTTFRTSYPQRPFYLLQPGGPSQGPLNQPASYSADPKAFGPIAVNRDNGNVSLASDWYTICNLALLPDGAKFALWIDNSGSMTTATVQASVNLLDSKIAPRGITYTLMSGNDENWVQPFNKAIN